ncbi:MAG: histidinol-phosphate aminotransferase family protein [Candidatus Heimdallarchaeota archaeon]|nr:histidinol-phosphate aminotransferase family protein [Candidatus Heimdallarchaeota archaeon]
MKQLSNRISETKYALDRLITRQKVAKKYNLSLEQILDLSIGDNLFIPPDLIQNIIIKEIQSIDPREQYPIDYFSLIEEIARFVGVETSTVYPGLTHNQLIQRIVRVVAKPENAISLIVPDKDIYYQFAKNQQLNIVTTDLTSNYELDVNCILEQIKKEDSKALVFSSPHYPTANQFKEEDVLTLAKETEIPVIIDESYVEFGKYSLVNQVQSFNNLTIVRSFSKAWGLGAFSSAFLVSNVKNIEALKENYIIEEIPPIHLLATNYILQAPYRFVELINIFIAERKRVIEHLRMLKGLKVHRSDTNFLLIQFTEDVKELFEQLCSKGIIIQTFENYPAFKDSNKSFLVTLGDADINDKIIMAIVEILESIL